MQQRGNLISHITGSKALAIKIICTLVLSLTGTIVLHANPLPAQDPFTDSIMHCILTHTPLHAGQVGGYKAQLYVKNSIEVKRRNFLLRFMPTSSSLKKGQRQFIVETFSDLHYTAPDIYDQKVKACIGTMSRMWMGDGRVEEYFHPQIYANTLINDKLLSPLGAKARQYYRFSIESIEGSAPERLFCISFSPRYSSYQLVKGKMWVSETSWSVRRMTFDVRSEYFKCYIDLKMGKEGDSDALLPTQVRLNGKFRFLGNKVNGDYLALLHYDNVYASDSCYTTERKGKINYNLTSSYTLSTDTNAYCCDTAVFSQLRPLPLSAKDKDCYEQYHNRPFKSDTSCRAQRRNKWNRIGSFLIEPSTIRMRHYGSVRMPPLVNPLMWGYSPSNGFSYSHRLRYQCLLRGDRQLSVTPYIGYNFKHKEFYWRINADFEYNPAKRRGISLEMGNGNRIYDSGMLDELEQMPDSVFDFDKMKLRYYRDLYMKLKHRWEIVNGLSLDINLAMHRRTGMHTTLTEQEDNGTDVDWADEYNSFAPGLRLSWTPGQYYYMSGKRKVNLHSRYPILSIDWEHGIAGILPHSGKYDRVEVDLQHFWPLGPMRDLYYRLGWGIFSKHRDTYFVDFNNFRRSNLPTGWGDDIGGVFHLLDGRWYNSSRQYFRGNFTFESPFLLLPHLGKVSRFVLNERIYLGTLVVPHLRPYIELGYGLGTHIFDTGVFVSFANWKYQDVGIKFTLELFSK